MKKHKKIKKQYTNESINKIRIIPDFLPKSKDLVQKTKIAKVIKSTRAEGQ